MLSNKEFLSDLTADTERTWKSVKVLRPREKTYLTGDTFEIYFIFCSKINRSCQNLTARKQVSIQKFCCKPVYSCSRRRIAQHQSGFLKHFFIRCSYLNVQEKEDAF